MRRRSQDSASEARTALALGGLLVVLAGACGDGQNDASSRVSDGGSSAEDDASSSTSSRSQDDAGVANGGKDGPICRSASMLDIFDGSGKLDPIRYRALAAAFASGPAVGFRFGYAASHYHPTPESFPTAFQPGDHDFSHGNGQPVSTWQIGGPWEADPGGYNSSAGQVLYVPDDANAVGLDAVQFIEVASAVVSQKPQLSWTAYGGGAPDPSTAEAKMVAAHGGPFRNAVAVARAQTTDQWTQDAIIAFQDGSLLTSGTHASGGSSNVFTKLPAGLVPTAIALTTNNELALVTVWDTANIRGGLAVVALGGPSNPGFWGDWNQVYPGLHSMGLFGFMKVLGVVWLDGIAAPIAVSASADIRWPMIGAPEAKTLDLSDETTRHRFMAGGDLSVRHAAAGFATVLSRSEKRVAFVDLQPVFELVNKSYFGDRAAFDKTRPNGQEPNQWPYTFDVVPEAKPVVVRTVDFDECPTAVSTTANVFAPHNFVDASDDRHARPPSTFAAHALIATEDGTIHVFDVGGLHDDTPANAAAIHEVHKLVVGRNPTSITVLGRSAHAFDSPVDYAVVSRGDRSIDLLHGDPMSSALAPWKTLKDSRLVDPISVEDVTWFGNDIPLIEVSDYGGRQLVAYRYDKAKLDFYGGREIGLGPDGSDPFECGGAYTTPGGVLFSSSTNVP